MTPTLECFPVAIPTCNRVGHLRNCVESLSRCTHADRTELVIGVDYPPSEKYVEGWLGIKEYVRTISGFGKVTVFVHEKNLGAAENGKMVCDYCLSKYAACIYSEDDNVFSPCFLDYMDKALVTYFDSERIVSVSGFCHEASRCDDLCRAFLSYDSNAWGFGLWRHKEQVHAASFASEARKSVDCPAKAMKVLSRYPALLRMLVAMVDKRTQWGDVMRTAYNIQSNHFQLRPSLSLVRNCGYDGTGIHCGSKDDILMHEQAISDEKTFDLGVEQPRLAIKGLFTQEMRETNSKFKYVRDTFRRYKKFWKRLHPGQSFYLALLKGVVGMDKEAKNE